VKSVVLSIVLGLVLLMSCGCATPPAQQYVPVPDLSATATSPGMARVYVVEEGGWPATIRDNRREIGKLTRWSCRPARRSFLCWERPPGRALLEAEYDRVGELSSYSFSVTLNTEPGGIYFIVSDVNATSDGFTLNPVNEATFRRYAKHMVVPEYVPGVASFGTTSPGDVSGAEAVPQVVPTASGDGGL
jgi:hypothetical protein